MAWFKFMHHHIKICFRHGLRSLAHLHSAHLLHAMETDLRCNRLTCRKALTDKAVVTTCSHIFCVECANELFNSARLCPACETSLTEPDDIVMCSLHPTNDYKTSVLSGLSPALILEICGRAIAFWQYQIHQESVFQEAVIRNLNDKNAQLNKQLDNVVREANGEITLLSNKIAEYQRDLELERKKVRDLQETARDNDKEYTKLKTQYDKIKRKALLGKSISINNDVLDSRTSSIQMQDPPPAMNIGNTSGGGYLSDTGDHSQQPMLPIMQAQGVQPIDKSRVFYPSAADLQNPWHSNPPHATRKTIGIDSGSSNHKRGGMAMTHAQRQPFEAHAQVPQTPTHQHQLHRLSIGSSTRSEHVNESENTGMVPQPQRTASATPIHSVRHQQQQPASTNYGWVSATSAGHAAAANVNLRVVRKPVQRPFMPTPVRQPGRFKPSAGVIT